MFDQQFAADPARAIKLMHPQHQHKHKSAWSTFSFADNCHIHKCECGARGVSSQSGVIWHG